MRGRGRECHTARGGAECCMAFETAPSSAVFPVLHEEPCYNTFIEIRGRVKGIVVT